MSLFSNSKRRNLLGSAALAFIFAIVALLSGCGGGGNNAAKETGTDKAQTPQSQPDPAGDTSEFVKLVWYMPPSIDPRPNEANVMKRINAILKEKINASLDLKFIDFNAYGQKVKVAAASGEAFDLFTDIGHFGFSQAVSTGLALDIDDLLNKFGQDIMKKIPDQAWQVVSAKGKKWGVPNPSAWVTSNNISFRKDIVEKHGIDFSSIHTMEDLEPVLAMLKEKEPDMIPYVGYMPGTQNMDLVSPMVGYDTTDGKWKSLLESTEWRKNITLQHDWYNKGYLPKKQISDHIAEFKTGKYAVVPYHVYDSSFVKMSTEFGIPMVSTPLNQKHIVTNGVIQSTMTYISKTSENPERAMMLINLLYQDKELLNLLAYGVEGEDWEYVSGKGTDNPTIKTNDQLTWAVWHPWIGSLWDQWPSNWNSQEVLDGLKAAIDQAEYSPFSGFVFDSAPVKKELAQIDAYSSEIHILYMTKDLDAKIAEYVEKVKKAGLDRVIAEIEKQVAAWKASDK